MPLAAPDMLKELQQWFGDTITLPLFDTKHAWHPQASFFVTPNQKLQPHERVSIYNRCYWYRLFSILQDSFPGLLRLFGYEDFNNSLATPYLLSYPPNSWALYTLGSKMPSWLYKYYKEEDRKLILHMGRIDWALHFGFFQKRYPQLKKSSLTSKFYLQPSISVLTMPAAYLPFRNKLMEHPVEHWLENDFPPLNKDRAYHYVIYRDHKNEMYWIEITKAQAKLLSAFRQGATIEKACSCLEKNEELFEEAVNHIQKWFKEWIQWNWIIQH